MSYIWETLDIERIIEKELIRDLGKSVGAQDLGIIQRHVKISLKTCLKR